MKTLFVEAKSHSKVDKSKIKEISNKLPKSIAIAYSIQFRDLAINIREILSKQHKITAFTQVLGCSSPKFPKPTKAILLIGQGKFHAIGLALETKLPIYIYENNTISQITKEEISKLEKKQKAAYLKYLHAEKVGILITTKPGQNRLKQARDFKKKLKDKKAYLFLANNINTNEFENFDLKSWVNTACPRMDMDNSSIININKIKH